MRYATDMTQEKFARFIVWALRRREFPSVAEVMDRYGCSKSTANKWLNKFEAASGAVRPRQNMGCAA